MNPSSQPLPGNVVFALDVPRVARFYQRLLGMAVVASVPGRTVLAAPAFELVVHALPPEVAPTVRIESPPQRRKGAPVKPFFPVDDFASARVRAAGEGGVVDPPQAEWALPRFRACDGHDPEGNEFQLRVAL